MGQQDSSSCCAGFLHDEKQLHLWGAHGPRDIPSVRMVRGWPPGAACFSWQYTEKSQVPVALGPHQLASSICPQGCCARRPVSIEMSADIPALQAHTENSGPPFLALICSRLNRKPTKGFIQRREGGPPKTDFIPSHRSLRSHVGFSLFSLSISVSSLHIE